MQFPESWLRTFVDPQLTTEELSHALTMAGLEVEGLRPAAPPTSQIVVGRVLEVVKHPDADKLNVCQVDAGTGATLNIVCGAPNVAPGIKVPVALVGAQLPPAEEGGAPFAIKLSKLRGVESQGMLCSARELKLSEDHSGLLILPEDTPIGQDIREALNLDDTVFEIKLTPNKADCLSVFGIARETAAITGAPLKAPQFKAAEVKLADTLPVRVSAPDLCGRFSGRVIRGVNARAKTPQWMVGRLERSAQRSISALVDISNYVMFEYGQPSHIFDLEKIHDRLVVRWARSGETLKLLNGSTVVLDADVGVIADERSVESLAGIMGGEATAVSDATRQVYIEAAFWWPEAVAGRSRRFHFATEAGHRFERGVDPASTALQIERITRLVLDVCGGRAGPVDDQILRVPEPKPVTLRVERAAKVIGLPLTQAQCAAVFGRLGMRCTETPGTLHITPPSWRFDLAIEEDLIEEVIRIVGYDKLPADLPRAPLVSPASPEGRRPAAVVRRLLAALDYHETINFSFVDERWERELAGNADPVRVLNPIVAPLAAMRSSLVGSLVAVLRHNLARKAARVRVFEVGRVFRRDPSAPEGELEVAGLRQPLRLGGLAYGPADPAQWGIAERAVDFYDVKGDVEALFAPRVPVFVADRHPALHPGRSARVEVDGQVVGHLGELHPQWRQAYELPRAPIVFELDFDALRSRPVPAFRPLPRQLAVARDLALVVRDGVAHDAVVAALRDDPDGLVRSATLFDVYKPGAAVAGIGACEHGLALRLELLDPGQTLTDERIDASVAAAFERAARATGARLRS
jgi:phenylalanyl-tRNA synthetase beta chain